MPALRFTKRATLWLSSASVCCFSRVYEHSGGGRRRSGTAMDVTEEQQHRARLMELLESRTAKPAGELHCH